MKTRTLLIAAVMFLGLTAASFAQASFTVSSVPVTAITATGVTERTGDITFTQVVGSPLAQVGTITVTYPVPITNNSTTTAGALISVVGTGDFANNVSINSVTNSPTGQVVINITAAGAGGTGSITLSGVRISAVGATAPISGAISSTVNTITAGQTNVVVVSGIQNGIGKVNTGSPVALVSVINGITGLITNDTVTVNVKDNYLGAFSYSNGTGAGNVTGIQLTLSQAPPAGISITFQDASTASDQASTVKLYKCDWTGAYGGDQVITSTSTSLKVCLAETVPSSPASLINLETLSITYKVTVAPTTVKPISPFTINATASMAPIGDAFSPSGTVLPVPANPLPRFQALEVGPIPLVTVPQATTTLLIPFAQTIKALGYDTGLAIANTTTDPGAAALGFPGAFPLTGPVKFYIYPQRAAGASTNPTAITYTTQVGSPGSGLDAAGNLPSGSTYIVLLSQILTAAGVSSDFAGQVFVITNFTNGHALYVVSNFTTFSQGSHALVVAGNRTAEAGLLQ